jgi:hypothetical protein
MTKTRKIIMVLLGLGIWAATPVAKAELSCKVPSVDSGKLLAGKPFKHSFILENNGKETIQILEVLSSCGCLRPVLPKTTLMGGESISLPIEIHTLTKPKGMHRFGINLRYQEAGVTSELALELKALIEVEVEVTPAAAAIFTDRAINHTLCVKDTRAKPMRIIAADSGNANVGLVIHPATLNENKESVQTITVGISDLLASGRHELWINLVSDDPSYTEMKIPLTIVKRDGKVASAAPSRLYLEGSVGIPLGAKMVRINKAGAGPVKVDKVECSHPAFKCTWAQGPGDDATLRLLLDEKKLPKGETIAELRVHLNGSQPQSLLIPVNIQLK